MARRRNRRVGSEYAERRRNEDIVKIHKTLGPWV